MKFLLILVFLAAPCLSRMHSPEENLGVNNPNLYEGDMLLTSEQRAAAEAGRDVDQVLSRGSARRGLWRGGVFVYTIHNSLRRYSHAMDVIRKGINMWASKTCIKFRERRQNERSYAYFQMGQGCSSWIGQRGNPQNINLARGCWTPGIVAHEIGHALGLYHEQSRPDRDDYVVIYRQNVIPNQLFNFNKYPRSTIDSLGTPYDYDSIMHYAPKEFSRNNRYTIQPRKQGARIGNRSYLSKIDIQQANLMYKCNGGGGGNPPPPPPENCVDTGRYCNYHVPRGDCKTMDVVKQKCRKSCGLC
ncbi:hypothetical protein ACROYT_G008371 [Oculina patagonica]